MKLLPMPHTARKRLSEKEWRGYWKRWERHLAHDSEYERAFHRPAIETAREVWQLIEPSAATSPLLSELIFRRSWLGPNEQERMHDVAKQALLVVLDTCVTAGHQHQLITVNTIFDALARRWSDHFRKSVATTVWDMKTTVQACRRDLLLRRLVLMSSIVEYEAGNAFKRWMLPSWGSTVLTIRGDLKDGERLVGSVDVRRTVVNLFVMDIPPTL